MDIEQSNKDYCHPPRLKGEYDMDTIDRNDAYTVTSLADLAKIYATPLPHIATKESDHITEVGRAFIAASPFLCSPPRTGLASTVRPRAMCRASCSCSTTAHC